MCSFFFLRIFYKVYAGYKKYYGKYKPYFLILEHADSERCNTCIFQPVDQNFQLTLPR
jgi:hypothetical protein